MIAAAKLMRRLLDAVRAGLRPATWQVTCLAPWTCQYDDAGEKLTGIIARRYIDGRWQYRHATDDESALYSADSAG